MSKNELTHIEFQDNLTKKGGNVFQQANMYFQSHKYKKAEEYYNLYLQQQNEENPKENRDLSHCYNNLARIYDKRGEYKTAIKYHEKCLNLLKILHGESHLEVSISYGSPGMVYDHQEDYKTALEYHKKALEISQSVAHDNQTSSFFIAILEWFMKSLGTT